MPSILIDMEEAKYEYRGIGNFCRNLGKHLLQCADHSIDFVFFTPREKVEMFKDGSYRISYKWMRVVRRLAPRADIWHITHQNSRYWPPNKKIPVILTVHDLNFLYENKTDKRKRARLKRLKKLTSKATVIVAISEFTKRDIEKHLAPTAPIEVIYNAAEIEPSQSLKCGWVKFPYLLALADINAKKNFIVLIDMLVHLPNFHLILAGKQHTPYITLLRERALQLGVLDRVVLPGSVTEAEKNWLYENCEAFFSPSLAEGFGLPVVEAMCFGKPVFLSKFTSLPEIGGPHAYYFDNFDAKKMAEKVKSGLADYHASPEKSRQIKAWSNQFTWQNTAKAYLDIYIKLSQCLAQEIC